jgi:hypothetical protein
VTPTTPYRWQVVRIHYGTRPLQVLCIHRWQHTARACAAIRDYAAVIHRLGAFAPHYYEHQPVPNQEASR